MSGRVYSRTYDGERGAPTGTVVQTFVEAEPKGWKLLNGQSLSKAAYPDLYAILAGRVPETSDTFTLPDFSGRAPFGDGGTELLEFTATTWMVRT